MLVSVDEIQKTLTNIIGEDVKTQEPPTITLQVTNVQPLDKVTEATSKNANTIEKDIVEIQATTGEQSQTGPIILSTPLAQMQGESQVIVEVKDKNEETKLTPKVKEKVSI